VGRVTVTFGTTIPALPAADLARSVAFYRDRLDFEVVHQEDGFASLRRDGATLHFWGATDEGWRDELDASRPVRSGAESFIAGTASCRIAVEGVDALHEECSAAGIVHPNGSLAQKPWGSREFTILDPDGNCVTFFE
jgi:catechol 2,3-dioxygenase-like lactoylglutathione lyase family enzyme